MKAFTLAVILTASIAQAQQDRPVRYFPYDPTPNGCQAITPLWNNWILGKLWECKVNQAYAGVVNGGTWVLLSTAGNPWLDPGIWKDELYDVPLDARIGAAVNPDQDRLYMTNAVGHRPAAVQGDINIPADPTATTYEADAVAGIAISQSSSTNAVAGSFFGALGADGPGGSVATSGTAVTRISGPIFQANWAGSFMTINSVEYQIAAVPGISSITLASSAGVQASVAWFKRIYVWSINALLTDGLPGAPGTPHYKHGYLTNEWDVNIFDSTTKLIMHSIGGNGNVQPELAYGYTVNTMSAAHPGLVMWTCGFCLLDGTATVAMQIGVSSTGNNAGSMPLLFYSRDVSGNTNGGTISTDPSGNILVHPAFTNVGGGDQQTLFLDRLGNIILGITGKGNGGPGVIQGGSTTRFQAGSDVLANLGAEGGAANVACSNCDTPVTEGAVCTAAGDHAGAWAIRLRGAWHCF